MVKNFDKELNEEVVSLNEKRRDTNDIPSKKWLSLFLFSIEEDRKEEKKISNTVNIQRRIGFGSTHMLKNMDSNIRVRTWKPCKLPLGTYWK